LGHDDTGAVRQAHGRMTFTPELMHSPKVRKDTVFLAWDGEGITDPDSTGPQRYTVFGHSGGGYVRGHDLSTVECLELLLEAKEEYPHHTFIGFAFNYDVNMIVRDMSKYHVAALWRDGRTIWKGYHLRYIPGKMFNVSYKGRKAAVVYDVFTFFGVSFVKALRSFSVADPEVIARIESGKDLRGSFMDEQMDRVVIPYWQDELRLLVDLGNALKFSLVSAGIRLKDWYGPGAVANQVLNRHKIRTHQQQFSPEIVAASCSAYAGGRFEQFKMGRYVGKVYQYDIRSAYPSSIVRLPSLARAKWHLRSGDCLEPRFYDLCHVEYPRSLDTRDTDVHPFHWRYANGNVAYPSHFDSGWHYGSVVQAARDAGLHPIVTEWYELEHDGQRPFHFVGELYEQRARWKKDGNPAQYAAKISLNSLYGKMAQQVGFEVGHTPRPPKFHQLEWAGMVTAQTRARLFSALSQAPEHVVACETDSVFSTVPLNLPLGEALGEWELTEHDELIYLQSGVYFTKGERHVNWKYRGMAKDGLSYNRVRQWLRSPYTDELSVSMVRFMGMGANLSNGKWCRWEPLTRTLDPLSVSSKRIHIAETCPACQSGTSMDDGLHTLTINPTAGAGVSAPHPLAWLTGTDYVPVLDLIDD
jgi:hypothetical protein